MALRMIEMVLPVGTEVDTDELCQEHHILHAWTARLSEAHHIMHILLAVENSEAVLNLLEKRYSNHTAFRIVLLPVEATLPRPPSPEEPPEGGQNPDGEAEEKKRVERISREELHADIVDTTRLSRVYIVLVILSTTVAAIGVLRDNVAVIIGSMVIAPLLGPNVALALSTTLADTDLARTALRTNLTGTAIAFAVSVLFGLVLVVDPTGPEIASRSAPGFGDIVLALAAGGAGALAFTTGLPTAVIGVMVAVALLPPLVVCGMLLGAGFFPEAGGALVLLMTNVICVNLAGVLTFLLQGIRPRTWWEADKARRATRLAILVWVVLLVALVGLILLYRTEFPLPL